LDALGYLGTQLLLAVMMLAVVLIPAHFTDRINARFVSDKRPDGLGCLPQVLIFCAFAALIFFMLEPAKRALIATNCSNSDDYQACIDSGADTSADYDRR
jgi:hypothetical protein